MAKLRMEVTATRIDRMEAARERTRTSFTRIRDNAGELVIKGLLKFRKKIPQRGLNNKSTSGWRCSIGSKGFTLPDRMSKLNYSIPYLPPQMVALGMTSPNFDEKQAKALIVDILRLLAELRINLKTVTVLEPPEWWGEMITKKENRIRRTASIFGLFGAAEFTIIDIPDIDYSPLGEVMDRTLAYTTKEVSDMLDTEQAPDMLWKAWSDRAVDKRTIEGTVYWAWKPTSHPPSVNP